MKTGRTCKLLVICCAGLIGCAHPLEVLNSADFSVSKIEGGSNEPLRVALVCPPIVVCPADLNAASTSWVRKRWAMFMGPRGFGCPRGLLQAMSRSLSRMQRYDVEVVSDRVDADVEVYVGSSITGEPQLKNLFIGFPGCILFAHVWNGFAYDVAVEFRTVVVPADEDRALVDFSTRRALDIRYTDKGNGGISTMWFLPPLGTCFALSHAIVRTMDYDASATTKLLTGGMDFLADSLAQEIVREIDAKSAKFKALSASRKQAKSEMTASQALSAERKKNLDSLLKSGVITEEEYRKELGKEAK